MTQKRRKVDSENALGRITALRWEPTHVTKHTSRVIPLQPEAQMKTSSSMYAAPNVG